MNNRIFKQAQLSISIMFLFLLLTSNVFADDFVRILRLEGHWKFSIGDYKEWADPKFNDSGWENIKVPSSWENEGFHGYDGYAWYRKKFKLDVNKNYSILYLHLGFIDDVDEVYLNGKLIGFSGSFPPGYETAYNAFRRYIIPSQTLNPNGENTIAVRVYDSQLAGGIISGDIGIYTKIYDLTLEINLEGKWKFNTGDDRKWKEINFDDSKWNEINVPAYWELQGYKDYEGFAWYRKKVFIPEKLKNEKLVLVLGKIDDLDEAYINGEWVGSTGNLYDDEFLISFQNEYQAFRGYYIPGGVVKYGKENTVAIRVYDGYKDGGIYEGPIGIVTQKKYIEYWKSKKKKNIWEWLFGN